MSGGAVVPKPVAFPPPAWPPAVSFRGHELLFQPRDTLQIVGALSEQSWSFFIPNALAEESQRFVLDAYIARDDSFGSAQLASLGRKTAEAVAGTNFDAACKLASVVTGNWMTFLAWCSSRGFDPYRSRVTQVLAAAYALVRGDYAEPKDIAKIDMQIWPPSAETYDVSLETGLMDDFLAGRTINPDGTIS